MTSNFIPNNVLASPVDGYYFLWAPLQSAWHNFKVAFSLESTALENKTEEVAKQIIGEKIGELELNTLESEKHHFYSHIGCGLLLSIPGLNILPFACLVIKAKEKLVPEDHTKPLDVKQIFEKKEDSIALKPQVLPKKEIKITHNEQQPTKKASEESTQTIIPRTSSGQVLERMKAFQPKQQELLKEERPLTRTSSFSKHESAKSHKELTVDYFILFPDESPESIIRKSKNDRSLPPNNNETEITAKLLLNFPGHTLEPKIKNAQENLNTLKKFLHSKIHENFETLYIQGTFSHDVQVETHDNPYEIVRMAIFACPAENFLALLEKYTFIAYHGVIRIS